MIRLRSSFGFIRQSNYYSYRIPGRNIDARIRGGVIQRIAFASGTNGTTSSIHPGGHQQTKGRGASTQNQRPNLGSKAAWSVLVKRAAILLEQVNALPALPPIWEECACANETEDAGEALFEYALKTIVELDQFIRCGAIRPDRRVHHQLSRLLEHILHALSHSSSKERSVHALCSEVLDHMRNDWRVDLQHKHREYAMLAAAREGQWQYAADLYTASADPEESAPNVVSASHPVGLYVVARAAKERNAPVVENVMDVVQRLTMVSPSEASSCKFCVLGVSGLLTSLRLADILAASTVIGLLGEWKDFIEYAQTSLSAARQGQVYEAALMNACLLSEKPNEALDNYRKVDKGQDLASAWHWGGGIETFSPLCDDLALQALGGSTRENCTETAWKIWEVIESSQSIPIIVSVDALEGMLSAFGNDGNWRECATFFLSLLVRIKDKEIVISSGDINELMMYQQRVLLVQSSLPVHVQRLRQCVSVVCNREEQHGVSMLCQFIAFFVCEESSCLHENPNEEAYLARMLAALSKQSCESPRVPPMPMNPVVASLRGLGIRGPNGDPAMPSSLNPASIDWSQASPARAFLHEMVALIRAGLTMQRHQEALTENDHFLLTSKLSNFVDWSMELRSPSTGALLLWWVEQMGRQAHKVHPSVFSSDKSEIFLTDVHLATSIRALGDAGFAVEASDLVQGTFTPRFSESKSSWQLSASASVNQLFHEGKDVEALKTFQEAIDSKFTTPCLYSSAATGLAYLGQHSGVMKVYRVGLETGNLSKALGIAALNATEPNDKEAIKDIVHNLASAKDVSEQDWVDANYFALKAQNEALASQLKETEEVYDTLPFAIHTLRTFAEKGLPPEDATLRLVAKAASASNLELTDENVPSDASRWIDLISDLLAEAEKSTLWDDAEFVTDIFRAYECNGGESSATEFMAAAIQRGVLIRDPQQLDTTFQQQ